MILYLGKMRLVSFFIFKYQFLKMLNNFFRIEIHKNKYLTN